MSRHLTKPLVAYVRCGGDPNERAESLARSQSKQVRYEGELSNIYTE